MIAGDYPRVLRGGPHRFDPDPRISTGEVCICSMSRSYRSHQPFWWRWLNPRRRWR